MPFQRILTSLLLFFISCQISYAQQYHAYQIPNGLAVPVLDGILSDSVWALVMEDSCLFGDSGAWGTPWTWHNNNLVVWRAVWSAETDQLFVAVVVQDDIRGTFDNSDPSNSNFRPWYDDSIEFYTDGDLSRGNYLGRFDLAQQWRVTGENHRVLANYPVYNAVQFYSGDDFLTAVMPGSNGNWVCEAVFNIYNNFPNDRKTIVPGDTIGWEIRYSDSDDKTWRDDCFITDNFVGWVYSGPAINNADYFGKLIFEPAIVKSILITSPAVNSVWYPGENGRIAWTSTGPIAKVTIEISYDDGTSWSTITDSTANDDEFYWEISEMISENCRIRISEFENSTVASTSERFSIVEKPSLQITTPKTGDRWYISYRNKISWTSQGAIDSVAIALSRDNGQTWAPLAQTPNIFEQFYWTVSGPVSNECLLQISDKKDPSVFAISQKFSIEVEPVLLITQPQLNETWLVGITNRIEWSFQGEIDSVKIQLTRNNGSTWEDLGKTATSDTTFDWLVTGPASADCQIKISDTRYPLIFSKSATFAIAEIPGLRITDPGSGTTWYVGSHYRIAWTSQGEIDSVQIKLSRDNGIHWAIIGTAPDSPGEFSWQATEPTSANCRISIENQHDPEVSDTTDFTFIIATPQIQISQPVAILYLYTQVQFIWQTFGPIELVNIELSRNGGQTWETLAARTNDLGYFTWQISGEPSAQCMLRVSDANHTSTMGMSTIFTIKNPALSLQSPTGGEVWEIDAQKQLAWQTEGTISQVKIDLTRDNESTWEVLAASDTNDGKFIWKVAGATSNQCKIRISDVLHSEISTKSDSTFTIAEIPFIQIQNPQGNETWLINTSQQIQWDSNSRVEFVNIKLSRDNRNTWYTLVRDYQNLGNFSWTVTSPEARQSCYLHILNSNDTTLYSENQLPFSIESAPVPQQLTLIAPSNIQEIDIGEAVPIQWQFTGSISIVKIELSRNGGRDWQELTTTSASNQNYVWQSQPPATRQCLLRVSDPASSAMAISDTLKLNAQFIQELVNPNSQPSGSSQNGYRLVSIPLAANFPGADSVLLDDLGEYNKINWRLFDLKDGDYYEFPETGEFIPGKSMFLIVRDAWQIIDAGPGYAVMDPAFMIPLERGWNFIANPYETRVSGLLTVDHLALSVSQEPITLYSYEGAWGISRDFSPWTGYALKTTSPDTLKICPTWNFGYFKPQPKRQPDGWRIQIIATCQNAMDSLNFLGTASDASLTRDVYDCYEPPPIGDFVRVFFPHRDWACAPDDYTIDFQKPNPAGNSWEFEVDSNIPNAEIRLVFARISLIEGDPHVMLLDLGMGTRQELNSNSNSIQVQLHENTRQVYRLLVGSTEFVNSESQKFAASPTHFQVYSNFPNPFNARTLIRFYVPEKIKITAEVFNVLGENVAQLIPQREFETGFYQIDWEAKDEAGRDLASGIYLLCIRDSRGSTIFQKMALVK